MGLLQEAGEVPGRGDSSLLLFSRAAVLHPGEWASISIKKQDREFLSLPPSVKPSPGPVLCDGWKEMGTE